MSDAVERVVVRMIEIREADVKRLYRVLEDMYEKYYKREISLDELQPEVDTLNGLYDQLILLKDILLEARHIQDRE